MRLDKDMSAQLLEDQGSRRDQPASCRPPRRRTLVTSNMNDLGIKLDDDRNASIVAQTSTLNNLVGAESRRRLRIAA